MKIGIRKYVSVLLLVLCGSFCVSAQETGDVVTSDVSPASAGVKKFRVGIYGGCSPVLGDMNQLIFGNAGGGLSFECDLAGCFGLGLNAGGNYNPLKTDKLASCWNIEAAASVYLRFALVEQVLFLQPELSYGVQVFFPEKAEGYDGELAVCYADQFVQAGAGLRIALSSSLEFELCPFYRLSPENGVLCHYAGGKIGIFCRF